MSASTPLPPADDPQTIYVLDVSGYVFRAYHALPPLSNASGEPTHAVLGFTNMLLKLVADQKPRRFCVALDPAGPSFRKKQYPEYKSNRAKAPEDLHQQLERCYEIVDAYQIPAFRHADVEADDLIATVTARARAAGYRVIVVSADKDLLQLVTDGVSMYDTMRSRVYGVQETIDKMGVAPEKVRDLLALMGDSSDNIPGVPSVGPKTAKQLLDDYGDIDGIYAHLDAITKKALKAKLTDHRDEAYLSRDLVTLRDDVPIDLDFDALVWSGGDLPRLRKLFTELEFTRLLDLLDPEPALERPGIASQVILERRELEAVRNRLTVRGDVALFTALEGDDPHAGALVGVALSDGETVWYVPVDHRYLGVPAQLTETETLEVLRPLLEDDKVAKRSAGLKREAIAWARRGIDLRGFAFDTTIASYLLEAGRHAHEIEDVVRAELGTELTSYDRVTDKQRGARKPLGSIEIDRVQKYAGERAELAWLLTERLGPRLDRNDFRSLLEDLELPLTRVLVALEITGVRVDAPYLERMSREIGQQLRELEARCHALAGREFNVASPRQLEAILFDELGLPVVKKTRTGRSTDQDVLEELGESHELPGVISEHRQLSKLKGTYLDALPKQVNPTTGRVHTVYNQAVAATGRLSSSDPNLQNIPIRTDVGRRIREAFVAEGGWEIFSADYSQIELRVLAHLSNDKELVEAFTRHEDVHVRTATALFEVDAGSVSREQRGQAKTVNYAVIYGQSHFMLARNLGIERTEAQRYIQAFFERYAGVAAYMEATVEEARRHGAVRTLLGRRRDLPDIRSRNRALRMAAERVARNTPIQGSAADIIKLAMVAIHRRITEESLQSRMLLTVHDELVFEAPPHERERLEAIVRACMEQPVELRVPLTVDSGWGATWGQAH
jgi:DNA polymerase-1